jgi:hypothetical protein
MPTSRLLVPALVLALLGAPAAAVAQDDATPDAASERQSEPAAAAEPAIGSAVSYVDARGDEIGTVTVVELTDPFEDFSDTFEVEEGSRFVAVEVTISGSELADNAETPLEAAASDFGLQTSDGFFYSPAYPSRQLSSADVPDLQTIAVDPGTEVTGLVFFQVPEDAEVARLFYTPESGRLILAADLHDAAEDNG